MCANSEDSGETARMRRLAWAFAGRLCDKYHNLMSWLIYLYKWPYLLKKKKIQATSPLEMLKSVDPFVLQTTKSSKSADKNWYF